MCFRKAYTTKIQTQCNHTLPWNSEDTIYSFHLHISHVAYTMGWPDTLCQRTTSWSTLRFSYILEFLHSGMYLEGLKYPCRALHLYQWLTWRIISPKILGLKRCSLLFLETFFLLSYEQILPFIFLHLFSFIILNAASDLILSLKNDVDLSMWVMNGFPSIFPLSICQYCFTISAIILS